jgi:uncharacterized protein (DUF1330 family)
MMTEEKTYVVVSAIPNPEEMESFMMYRSKIPEVVMKFGGKTVGQYKTAEQVVGTSGIKVHAIIEFPDAQSIKNMVASEEFKALSELRSKAFKELNMIIANDLE